MKVTEAIYKRRSVRDFSCQTVSEEDVNYLLKVGQQAPSVHNGQPWKYLVVRNKERLYKLAEMKASWSPLKNGNVMICMFVDIEEYCSQHTAFFAQDCAAATQNILLAATEKGLGSLWLGIYPNEELCARVREYLQLPKQMIAFNFIVLGYPREDNSERVQRKEADVFIEFYKD